MDKQATAKLKRVITLEEQVGAALKLVFAELLRLNNKIVELEKKLPPRG